MDPKFRMGLFDATRTESRKLEAILAVNIEVEGFLSLLDLLDETRRLTKTVTSTYDTAYVRKVEISNFRAIDDLTLNFSEWEEPPPTDPANPAPVLDEEDKRVGWKMLLGENGTGESHS